MLHKCNARAAFQNLWPTLPIMQHCQSDITGGSLSYYIQLPLSYNRIYTTFFTDAVVLLKTCKHTNVYNWWSYNLFTLMISLTLENPVLFITTFKYFYLVLTCFQRLPSLPLHRKASRGGVRLCLGCHVSAGFSAGVNTKKM